MNKKLTNLAKFSAKEDEWLSATKNYISPKEVRKKLDSDQRMKSLYDFLSENVHPKTQSISNVLQGEIYVGGIYNEDFSDLALFIMLCSIEENVYTLYDILRRQNHIESESFLVHARNPHEVTELEELMILSTGQFILSERFRVLFKKQFEL